MLATRLTLAAAALCAGISTVAAKDIPPGDVKIVDGKVTQAVTDAAVSVADGRKAFADRKLGNCLAERWTPEELRAIVINSKAVFGEQTVMPGFYSLDVGVNVREDLVGKTILTAEQVESIVAYLATLK